MTLSLARGEMLALLGPSGSGKTTTLRLLAGFETPDAGRVVVDGEDVTRCEPVRRRFGMVFQHYALFPHLDVGENVAFGLESLGVQRPGAGRARVARALALVDLAGFERRRIGQLSGGPAAAGGARAGAGPGAAGAAARRAALESRSRRCASAPAARSAS